MQNIIRLRTFSSVISIRDDDMNPLQDEVVDEDLSRSDTEPPNSTSNGDGDYVNSLVSSCHKTLNDLREGAEKARRLIRASAEAYDVVARDSIAAEDLEA